MVTIISISNGTGDTFVFEWRDNGKQYRAYLFTAEHIQRLEDCTNDTCKRDILNNGVSKMEL